MFVFPGFNSNIDHRDKKYHIQTEVNTTEGVHKINTLVYFSGMIYFSLSAEMNREDSLSRDTSVSAIRKQHNKIIRDLISDQLAPQKSVQEKDKIDFLEMYKDDRFFSCHLKNQPNLQEVFKKLIVVPEDEA